MKLENKVAIVTAAGRGIGRGIAVCLAAEGANIVINSYTRETTASTVDEIIKMGRKAIGVAGDITKPEMITQAVMDAIRAYGKIDILVNNVGGISKTPKEAGEDPLGQIAATWDTQYEQNLRAQVLMCEAVAPHFIKQRSGKMINVASVAGKPGFPGMDAYGTMKAAIIRYTQGLADRLGPSNINVNCVCPGIIYTDLWKYVAEGIINAQPELKGMDPREWFLGLFDGRQFIPGGNLPTPLRREQTVRDIGQAVVFLASEDAANISGQALNVDGGMIKS